MCGPSPNVIDQGFKAAVFDQKTQNKADALGFSDVILSSLCVGRKLRYFSIFLVTKMKFTEN